MNFTEEYFSDCVVVYHGRCKDGIASAYILLPLLKNDFSKFIEGFYKVDMKNEYEVKRIIKKIKDKHVIFLDFTYRKEVMITLLNEVKSILVLDHHQSALELQDIQDSKFTLFLDMKRSGCQLTYDFVQMIQKTQKTQNTREDTKEDTKEIPCTPLPRPKIIDIIADEDLWKWEIEDSKAYIMGLQHYHAFDSLNSFSDIQDLINKEGKDFTKYILSTGEILLEDQNRKFSTLKASERKFSFNDKEYKVILCQGDYEIRSHLGHFLCEKYKYADFVVVYNHEFSSTSPTGVVWNLSLRSIKDEIDLPSFCSKFNTGGGHKKACGATFYGDIKEIFY
jgi:oligoribonuclease NrnB/cAMP/cGMP phosphodiesterase (DHH superfamily)